MLCHRVPFPPNKGDKIRSYHWLTHLSEHYDVHLGTFVDDEDDWKHADAVQALCKSSHLVRLGGLTRGVRAAFGLATGQPLTVSIYEDRDMRSWVDRVVSEHGIELAFVFSSAMAEYAFSGKTKLSEVVVDFVDVDSDKWRQYAESKSWPLSWIYRREARKLLDFESQTARKAKASVFVSDPEVALFRSLAQLGPTRVESLTNGVDSVYFDPEVELVNPFPAGCRPIVFTGAMDYWANVDAVSWFVDEVLDAVRRQLPDQKFYIVGARPTAAASQLASDSVVVTGSVEDIRPYIRHAGVVVAPLRIARGIQNKVLEAMSMGRPVVVSPQGLDGLNVEPGREVILAATADEFVTEVVKVQSGNSDDLGAVARSAVTQRYTWQVSYDRLDELMGLGS